MITTRQEMGDARLLAGDGWAQNILKFYLDERNAKRRTALRQRAAYDNSENAKVNRIECSSRRSRTHKSGVTTRKRSSSRNTIVSCGTGGCARCSRLLARTLNDSAPRSDGDDGQQRNDFTSRVVGLVAIEVC